MILVLFALLLHLLQFGLGPDTVLASMTHSLQTTSTKASQAKIGFVPTIYTSAPEKKSGANSYNAQAKAALIYDVGSGKVLYEKQSTDSMPMASLTKLMTAMVLLQNHSPDEIVTIPENLPVLSPADQKLGVSAGERFTLSELMPALLIYSANDVANSLAIWDSGSIDKFAVKMNDQAKQWGLSDSNFVNPTGLDAAEHQSSANDLLILANILLHNKSFRTIINTQKTTVRNLAGKPYIVTTTNQNLNLPYVYGIKTGLTDAAGQSLILLAKNNDYEIITVVLNSPDRFQESKNMIDYTFNNYIWK